MEGHCPNCGAPIEMNQSANCAHCKALLRSGEYDWVLAEITQMSEWRGAFVEEPPSVAALRQRDANFNVVDLEDRTSVMFWRKAQSDRLDKIDPLRRIATPEFCQLYAAALHPPPDATRVYFEKCAVGSVRLKGVLPGAVVERAVIAIHWSGTRMAVHNGRATRDPQPHTIRSLFVLQRQAGSVTRIDTAISSAHCPTCGAPESGGASAACEFCGTILNDGTQGWILSAIIPESTPAALALHAEMGSEPMPARRRPDGSYATLPSDE
jgi:predicted nucleic acid-binding Zn ribbon protein